VESLTALYYLAGVLSVVAGGVVYLSKQLNSIKTLIYNKTEQLKEFVVAKLEYHEKHDDARFDSIRNDLWEIRLSNARFGMNGKEFKTRAPRTEATSGE
jgi:hypothetical protein